MERVSKVILILTIVLASDVEGRMMKSNEDQVDHPQNFYGGAGGVFFPGSGPAIVTGIGFSPSGVCILPGGCVPIAGSFPTIPGGVIGSGGSGGTGGGSVGTGGGSAPIIPHN